jgi:hypothetical protein
MKALIFDAGPIISLTMNNLLWTLEPLKQKFGGEFCITEGVKREVVDKPLSTKQFKLDALQVMREIRKGTIKVLPSARFKSKSERLLNLANDCFYAYDHPVKIVHWGEIETLAACIQENASSIVVDERTLLFLVESPHSVQRLLERKNHTSIHINEEALHQFIESTKNVKTLRSIELIMIAYELGILSDLVNPSKDGKETLLDALFWGLKLQGCALSRIEIQRALKHELRR